MPDEAIRGEARGPVPRDHHRGFDLALEDAVRQFAERNGPTNGPIEKTVTFSVLITVTNPGRIEGYVATLS